MFLKAPLYLLVLLLCSSVESTAQVPKKPAVDKQRMLQWKPEKGQYYFSHAMVFTYQDKVRKASGEIKIYVDPVTGTLCFKQESSFGKSSKAFDFIMGFADGKYVFCGSGEDGKKIKITTLVEEVKPGAEDRAQQKEDFSTYCIPTGKTRQDFGWESVEYELTHATSDTKENIWLTQTPFGIYPLYGFDLLEEAVSLPVSLDYTYLFGPNQLLSEMDSKDLIIKLKSFDPDPFLALTRDYKEVKAE